MSNSDKECVSEIMEVLKKHNALKRFGLSLLHQHFDTAEDEILVEITDATNRVQTIRPIKKSELKEFSVTETSWRMDTGSVLTVCVCVNYGGDMGHSHQGRG